jgi:hypothetical protein
LCRHRRHKLAATTHRRPTTRRHRRTAQEKAAAVAAGGADVDRVSRATSPAHRLQGQRFPDRWINRIKAARATISSTKTHHLMTRHLMTCHLMTRLMTSS